ncbi:MAG: heme lyase CcmF/NrfE family subunit [Firmicutes bacterium]|nr:heme lyase CcmF/NrfE family subunit [Bacillota bacterium]
MAFLVNLYALGAVLIGIRNRDRRFLESGKNGIGAVALLTTFATVLLAYQFMASDFSNSYVFNHSATDLPTLYKFSALWAGNEGSLLLWAWLLAVYAAAAVYFPRREAEEMLPYVSAVLLAISLFFTFILNFVTLPFASMNPVPAQGMGLNPLLQDPGMVIHPPTLYAGYVGFTVPFAYAMAFLFTRKVGDTWIKVTRRWTLWSWLFLSIGIIFGAQWAYVVLGWGGYWAWDPVENASLLPWLTGTAFLHSVMIQERKGMLKIWNVMLIIVTFLLTVFGTFLSRSGVLASVHAFSDTTLGAWFLIFMATTLAASLYLAFDRMPLLREDNQFEAVLSKESSFLLNNLLLVGSAFAVFWGTIFPLISEAVRGVKVTVGPGFFNQVNVPIGLVLIFLVGICPLIPWRKASWNNLKDNFLYPVLILMVFLVAGYLGGIRKIAALLGFGSAAFVLTTLALEFYRGVRARRRMTGESIPVALGRLVFRNRRRYGGYLVHLSIIMMIVGITGSSAYQVEKVYTVKPGQVMSIGNYQLRYSGLGETEQGRVGIVYADLTVTEKGYTYPAPLRATKEFYPNMDQPTTRVGIKGGLKEDLFVILNGWEKDMTANFKIYVNPLVAWIWLGEYLLVAATVFAMWPQRRRLSRANLVSQAAD